MNELSGLQHCQAQRVLFVTTKEKSYIRNRQEIESLTKTAKEVIVIASESKNYLWRILYAYWGLIRYGLIGRKVDTLFIGFSPQLFWPLWPWIQRSSKTVCIDFFISVYDTFVDDRKKVKPGGLFARFFLWIDRLIWHGADDIIVDTAAHGAYLTELLGSPSGRVHVVYLKADTSLYYPPEKPPEVYHVIFFGSVLPVQGVDVILQALTDVLAVEPKMHVSFIGPLNQKQQLQAPQGAHVDYYEWMDQSSLAKLLQTGTLGLAGHFSGTVGKAKRTIAGKTYIYLAVGLPVILGDSPANRERFFPSEQHLFVPLGDKTALAGQILKHYTLWKERNEQS